jgi:hypothetical protein
MTYNKRQGRNPNPNLPAAERPHQRLNGLCRGPGDLFYRGLNGAHSLPGSAESQASL